MSGFLSRIFQRTPRDLAGAGLYLHQTRGVAVPAWASRMYVTDFGLGAEGFDLEEAALGQAVLTALNSEIAQVAEAAVAMTLDDITNSALGADLAALRHETQDVRIFKT